VPPYELFHQIIAAAIALAVCIKKEPSIAYLTQELQAICTTLENQETNQKETVKTLNNLGNQLTCLAVALSPMHSAAGKLPWATMASSYVTSSSS
jgi:uracil phosphoribosyltransferase